MLVKIKLLKFMSNTVNNKRRIYSLDHLKPEVTAVCFAKCSRSADSFEDIAKELTEEKSSQFHEKYVVGYGHGSVAEHASLHVAIENVSILATKVIEDNRLASFTEKSTRYQIFDRDRYYKPKKIMTSPLASEYVKTMDFIYDTYNSLFEPMKAFLTKKYPQKPEETDQMYHAIIKSRTCDNIRYLLPCATLTNLGVTANARVFEHAITKLLSHPLDEMKDIGQDLKDCTVKVTPTLVKYADANEYLSQTVSTLEKISQNKLTQKSKNTKPVTIVDYDKDAENHLVTALLYRGSNLPYQQIFKAVKKMSLSQKSEIVDAALKNLGSHDTPLRELEHVYYTFDILMDYGAFRDIQRSRMCTQTNQDLTIEHGYEIPEEIKEAGLLKTYQSVIKKAVNLYKEIYPIFPKEAQYVIPFAFRKRTLFTWNLRELYYFIQLRSGQKGHISYRRIAQACWQELNKIHPLLAKYIKVDMTGGSASWAASLYKKSN